MTKQSIGFYDLRAKKKFTTTDYKLVTKSGRRFATTTAPSGCKAFVIVGKNVK